MPEGLVTRASGVAEVAVSVAPTVAATTVGGLPPGRSGTCDQRAKAASPSTAAMLPMAARRPIGRGRRALACDAVSRPSKVASKSLSSERTKLRGAWRGAVGWLRREAKSASFAASAPKAAPRSSKESP
jgi:hypothetical protein